MTYYVYSKYPIWNLVTQAILFVQSLVAPMVKQISTGAETRTKQPSCQGVEKQPYCRMNISTGEETLIFTPDPLQGEEASSTVVKRAAFGATLVTRLDQLNSDNFKVVWDCVLVKNSKAPYIRPVRPRLWSLGKIQMESGKMYKIA